MCSSDLRRPDEVAAVAQGAVDEVVAAWAGDPGELQELYKHKRPESQARLRYHSLFEGNFSAPDAAERFSAPDGLDAINTLLYRRGWTDGLPVVPPTRERVQAMIGAWDGDALLGQIGRAHV